jgi:23S rRNA (cytosine1962-C5)-methyltransferase
VTQPAVFAPVPWTEHALLDSGGGEKLERFGALVLRRPDPQALWRRRLAGTEWERAELAFVRESDRGGRWEARRGTQVPASWTLTFDGVRFSVKPTPFKHVGVFPEQAPNWRWTAERLAAAGADGGGAGASGARVLNLFGYTGVASLLARRAGADVTHVDASRTALAWARENAELSGLSGSPGDGLRWVLDDALAFARREARRGASYTGILLDPPHYGRGPKGEKWQLETGLVPLLEACGELLAARSFLVLSSYAVGYSAQSLANLLGELPGGDVEAGELVLAEESAPGRAGRLLPCGFAARWARGLA